MQYDHLNYVFGQSESYRVTGVLGSGGFGVVYKIRNESGRQYACKILSPAIVRDAARFNEYERESQIGIDIFHEHLVSFHRNLIIHGNNHSDDHTYPAIIMDFVDGCDLGAFKARYEQAYNRPFSRRFATLILAKACSGLDMLHRHQIRHGDIKPENILMSKTGYPKVTDYGISTLIGDVQGGNFLAGTFRYMAPEQIRKAMGEKVALDHRADIYSLGIVALEIMVGLPEMLSKNPACIMNYTLNRNEELLRFVEGQDLTPDLKFIIKSCLHRDLNKRPNRIRHLQNVLLNALYGPSKGITLETIGDTMRRILDRDVKSSGGPITNPLDTNTPGPLSERRNRVDDPQG